MQHPPRQGHAGGKPAAARQDLEGAGEETALKAVKSSKEPGISEGELEVEQSCLIYSFDIQIPGKSGVQEVMVDAGTGKVLSQTHESALHESAEHAADQRRPSIPAGTASNRQSEYRRAGCRGRGINPLSGKGDHHALQRTDGGFIDFFVANGARPGGCDRLSEAMALSIATTAGQAL